MPRWEPDTEQRLQRAAFELFAEQGFAATTVPQIAERAGVTRRTFFRWFPDKREVLFAGAGDMVDRVEQLVTSMPTGRLPRLDDLGRGIGVIGEQTFAGRRDQLRARARIIAADEELRERDLHKNETLHSAMVRAFIERGVTELEAEVTAGLAMTVFRVVLARWLVSEGPEPMFADLLPDVLDAVRAVVV